MRRRIGGRRRVPKPRAPGAAEHGELSLEADGGGGDERDTEDRARVREEVSRGDVIRAVEDDVGVSHEVERVAWGDAFEMCRDAASGVERADGGGAGDSLGRAAAGLGVDNLTVKIGQFDDVGVGEGEATDARAGEVERGGGSETADAHDERAGVREHRLLGGAEGGERDLARVSLEVRARQGVTGGDALPRAEMRG